MNDHSNPMETKAHGVLIFVDRYFLSFVWYDRFESHVSYVCVGLDSCYAWGMLSAFAMVHFPTSVMLHRLRGRQQRGLFYYLFGVRRLLAGLAPVGAVCCWVVGNGITSRASISCSFDVVRRMTPPFQAGRTVVHGTCRSVAVIFTVAVNSMCFGQMALHVACGGRCVICARDRFIDQSCFILFPS